MSLFSATVSWLLATKFMLTNLRNTWKNMCPCIEMSVVNVITKLNLVSAGVTIPTNTDFQPIILRTVCKRCCICNGGSRIPHGRGHRPSREGGHKHTILPNFPKNVMKLKKFWAVRGRAPGVPLFVSPLIYN